MRQIVDISEFHILGDYTCDNCGKLIKVGDLTIRTEVLGPKSTWYFCTHQCHHQYVMMHEDDDNDTRAAERQKRQGRERANKNALDQEHYAKRLRK